MHGSHDVGISGPGGRVGLSRPPRARLIIVFADGVLCESLVWKFLVGSLRRSVARYADLTELTFARYLRLP
jgi:hypothetical protein